VRVGVPGLVAVDVDGQGNGRVQVGGTSLQGAHAACCRPTASMSSHNCDCYKACMPPVGAALIYKVAARMLQVFDQIFARWGRKLAGVLPPAPPLDQAHESHMLTCQTHPRRQPGL
jgi:hypothetical protein